MFLFIVLIRETHINFWIYPLIFGLIFVINHFIDVLKKIYTKKIEIYQNKRR